MEGNESGGNRYKVPKVPSTPSRPNQQRHGSGRLGKFFSPSTSSSRVLSSSDRGYRNDSASPVRKKMRSAPDENFTSRPFGFRRLDALQKCPGIQIMEILTNPKTMSEFGCLSDKADLTDDFIKRIVWILGKLSRIEFNKIIVQLIQKISTHIFLNQLVCLIVKYHEKEIQEEDFDETCKLFDSIAAFCYSVIKLLPTLACEKLSPIIKQSIVFLNSTNFDGIEEIKNLMNINFEKLEIEKQKRRSQPIKVTVTEEALHVSSPPEDFRTLSTVPLTSDLLRHKNTFLRPSIVAGPYKDVEHYLDVQYRLLREDFVRPLRDGISEYIKKKHECINTPSKGRRIKVNNIKIYSEVIVEEAQIIDDEVGFVLNFDPKGKFSKTINWEQSKRFMLGSLLVLTKNDFETILLAKVLKHNVLELQSGRVLVEIVGDIQEDDWKDSAIPWLMAESTLFFGAYCHVLEALKNFDQVNFPLKAYIVEGRNDHQFPSYLEMAEAPIYRIQLPSAPIEDDYEPNGREAFFNPLNTEIWPSAQILGLDDSQYEALKGALSQKLMLIQGPPGTGKTFLGLLIASILLENSKYWWDAAGDTCSRPMVVVCYTNHALDQFLMGIMSKTSSIVRVGGGSKEKALERFHIRNLLRSTDTHHSKDLSQMIRGYRIEFKYLKERYSSILASKSIIECGEGIVDPQCLCDLGVMSLHQLFSFEDRDDFVEWLEGGFPMKNLHRQLDKILLKNICKVDVLNEEKELIYLISFEMIEAAGRESKKKNIADYYYCKYKYLQNQLLNPKHDPKILDLNMISKLRSLKQLQLEQRWQLYRFWISELIKVLDNAARDLQPRLQTAASNLKEAKMVEEQDVMSTCRVIGMTTSYAASRQPILKQLRPRIVIVEEAAEVLEAHVVVSLTDSVDHLIMIGDHLQLKPNPAVYELGTKYRLNVSLFERLINNKVQCVSLTTQHRMRPEIARLVSPAIYPLLINHESVLKYPSVRGISQNVAFINHGHHQEEVEEIQSFRNVHEAKFISAMIRYLRLQGYEAGQITVLATYKGQMFYLHKLRDQNPLMSDVRITVVDNYQGEENDIILLSLVRSNDEGNVGFLKIENRVCVALSRAKHGLFIFGNMENLVSAGDIWPKVLQVLRDQNAFVEALPLECRVHSTVTEVSCGEDFKKVPEGGCLRQCATMMPCGHICAQLCHVTDREHANFKCYEPCAQPLCEKNHICPGKCFEKCEPCKVPTDVTLPCKHTAVIACHVDPSAYNCLEVVKHTLVCDHQRDVFCFETKTPDQIKCLQACKHRLEECGHVCERNCHVLDDPNHELYECRKPCSEKNVDCNGEHFCKKVCFEDCDTCVIMVKKTLPCNHQWTMKCCETPSRKLCGMKCTIMNECGHMCKKKCRDDCDPCLVEVEKTIPDCGHRQMMQCGKDPISFKSCKAKCERKLPCGHTCTKTCREQCSSKCREMVVYPKPTKCGHLINVPCYQKDNFDANSDELLKFCVEPCQAILQPCEHRCKGNCGACWQGHLHKACQEPCGRVLVCGHSCKAPCADKCPPCSAPCSVRCQHSECPRKCGQPCIPCKELCPRKCMHGRCKRQCGQMCSFQACHLPCNKTLKKCKHKCIGLCGDDCICEECHESIREILFGTEENEDARFVQLPDCKHIFESSGLEEWLQQDQEIKEHGRAVIKEKVCPKCSTPIRTCLRFNEIIMRHVADVQAVKLKVYGNIKHVLFEASRIRDALSSCHGLPEEMAELKSFVTLIFKSLSSLEMYKRARHKEWGSTPLSLSEVRNLNQYAIIISTIAKLGRKAFKKRPLCTSSSVQLNEKSVHEVIHYISKLLCSLKGRNILRLSDQEAKDITAVLKRLDLLIELCCIESSPGFTSISTSSKLKVTDVSDKIRGVYVLKETDFSDLTRILGEIAPEVESVISPVEIASVVSAMGMSKGHWFKCPNGHVYAIGDCGGAMVESSCNECGATIGGGSHQLRSDNTFAPEMDGAAAPAWPGMAAAAAPRQRHPPPEEDPLAQLRLLRLEQDNDRGGGNWRGDGGVDWRRDGGGNGRAAWAWGRGGGREGRGRGGGDWHGRGGGGGDWRGREGGDGRGRGRGGGDWRGRGRGGGDWRGRGGRGGRGRGGEAPWLR